MNYKSIDNAFSVSGQITAADIDALKAKGIRSIVCNRPDHEDIGQPAYQALESAIQAAGLQSHWMPVASGGITYEDGERFKQVLDTLPVPVHAYCRSGTRCTTLWALAQIQRGVDPQAVVEQAAEAGYNLSALLR